MARLCPQCGEIHFETTTTPMPLSCRKCNSDLNGVPGLIPNMPADGNLSDQPKLPGSKAGVAQILIGFGILALTGGLIYFGLQRYNGAKEVTAVVVEKAAKAQKHQRRDNYTAEYTVNGKVFYQYPGIRQINDQFKIYYFADKPDDADEQRPYACFLAAAVLLLVGMAILAKGALKLFITRAREADFNKFMGHAV